MIGRTGGRRERLDLVPGCGIRLPLALLGKGAVGRHWIRNTLFAVVAEDAHTDLDKLQTRVGRALGAPLEERWDEVLAEWSGSEPADRRAVRDEVTALRNRLRETLAEFSSLDGLQRAIAVAYAEVKCRWTLLTIQIRDRTDRDGRVDDRLIHRATCVSLIVQQIDPLVRHDDLRQVSDFIAEPLDDVARAE